MMTTKKFQSIRIRTLQIIGIVALALMTVTYILLVPVLKNNIRELEEQNVRDHVRLVENTLRYEQVALAQAALDWGRWDDAYRFAADRNQDYLTANMTGEAFANMGIDFLIYLDVNGNCLYQAKADPAAGGIKPMEDGFLAAFGANSVRQNAEENWSLQGFTVINGEMAMVASAPVLPSRGTAPVRGNIIMGRYVDGQMVQRLSENLHIDLEIRPLAALASADVAVFQSLQSAAIAVREIGPERMEGYSILYSIDDQPLLGLRIKEDRGIMRGASSRIYGVLLALMALIVAMTGGVFLFIEKRILSRVLSVNKEVARITETKDFAARLSLSEQQDEIGLLTDNINRMIAGLGAAESQITEMSENLEGQIKERTSVLSSANQILQDEIIQREKIEEQIKYLAYHDALTNLPNRLLLNEQITHSIALTKRLGKMLAVMFIDLDNFKLINDTLGHSAGDKLLIAVSGKLIETLRESDFIARIGGDEFVILIENLEGMEAVDTVAQKVLQIFKDPVPINKQECFVSASIGVALYPEDGTDAESLIKNADIAMYKAKGNGKNQYVFCTPMMKSSVVTTMKLTNSLYHALERQELEVYYQPQLSCQSGEIIGMEALLRWNHPELGTVLPGEFIPIAEQNGLISGIGLWMLQTACRQNKEWQEKGHPKVAVAVNLSIRQFLDAKLLQEVEQILTETGLEPQYLELEITESIAMKENKYVNEVLYAFKQMGVRISIDDFGTEYASFIHLKHLPVDKIKIDMMFVQGVDVYKKDEAIVKAIILLAKNMGFVVIAEGVETARQFDFLVAEKCDGVQGRYCHIPLNAEEVEAFFAGRK